MISEHTFAVARAVKSSQVWGMKGRSLSRLSIAMVREDVDWTQSEVKCCTRINTLPARIKNNEAFTHRQLDRCRIARWITFSFLLTSRPLWSSRYMIWRFYRLIVYKSAIDKTRWYCWRVLLIICESIWVYCTSDYSTTVGSCYYQYYY